MSKHEFDEFATNYDEVLADAMPPGMAENVYFAEYKIKLVHQQLQGRAPRRILDFGCGPGRSIAYIRRYFPDAEVWGFDVSEDSVKQARSHCPDARFISDMAEITDQKFDLIVAANVFHHIPLGERRGALQDCGKVLSPTGSIYLFEHNPYNPVTRWIFERCAFDVDAVMLPRRETMALARAAALKVARSGYTLFFPAQLAWLRFLEPFMSAIPVGAQYYVRMQAAS